MTTVGEMNAAFEEYEKEDLQRIGRHRKRNLRTAASVVPVLLERRIELRQLLGLPSND
jgi:hypothetical protein